MKNYKNVSLGGILKKMEETTKTYQTLLPRMKTPFFPSPIIVKKIS